MKAYVFDAYGTLFDVHSAVRRHGHRIGDQAGHLSDIWRIKQLEYTWVRTLTDAYLDFERVTAQALDFAMSKCGITDAPLRADLLAAYDRVEAYDDVAPTLLALKATGAKLAILSNGTDRMLQAALDHAGLVAMFDAVLSVHALHRFKTDPKVYAMATAHFGLEPGEVSFQSSNRWDIAGATRFGFRTIWINRTAQPDEYPDLPPHLVLPGLHRLAQGI